LRSFNELIGYNIYANNGQIGHSEDFIVDDEKWKIRYIVVNTKELLPGKNVLISPSWVDDINWGKSKISLNQNQKKITESPEYDPLEPVNREYEERLYDYYGRHKYWDKS